mgnify:CR=1 FL=1
MPFSEAEFFDVFARYNAAIWPLPVVAGLLGVAVIALLFVGTRTSTLAVSLALSAMWVINGLGYHWSFFSGINPAARVFAAIFVMEAILLAAVPLAVPNFRFVLRRDLGSAAAVALAVFALVVYPILGRLAGHVYPSVPAFGVAPCPTTIFTIGVLLAGPWRSARWLLIIPGVWSAIGGSAAVLLAVPQDFGLIAALAVLVAFAVLRRSADARRDA